MRSAALPAVAAVLLAVGVGAADAAAQGASDRETGVLSGTVLSPEGAPLAGVSVADLASGQEARTGGRGKFRFGSAPRGFHVLLIGHPRLGADTVRTAVAGGKTVFLTLRYRERGELVKRTRLDTAGTPAVTRRGDAGAGTGTARIVGRLVARGSGRPVEAATVYLPRRAETAVTGEDGRFVIDSLPGGSHRLRVDHVGYGSRELVVDVPAARTAELRVGLAPEALPMPPVEVDVRLRSPGLVETGFYRRRRRGRALGFGHFLVGEEIRRRGGNLARALATVPRLRSSGRVKVDGRLVSGLLYFPQHHEERFGPCLPAIYLDDHKVVGSGSPAKAAKALGPTGVASLASVPQVAGVEIYDSPASTLGPYQGSDSRCGVVAIWTESG